MATQNPNDPPLRELKHEAVPGYLNAFIVAFAVMGIYLAIILITSPGPAKGHDKSGHDKSGTPETHAKPGTSTDGTQS